MVVDDSIQTEADLEFLASLDERLHETVRYRDGPYRGRVVHCATEEQISVEELERVLDIIKDGDFFFFPGAISWGLETGYWVFKYQNPFPGAQEKELVLLFGERQLPEGYNFERLSEHFMTQINQYLVEQFGFERIVNDRAHYGY